MMIAALVMSLGSITFDGTPRPMVGLIALCALGTLASASATLLMRSRVAVS